ncbi:MAG: hypothetical protein AAB965_03455, partial [Patescibacteria group bacterium]
MKNENLAIYRDSKVKVGLGKFVLKADWKPAVDQPGAIKKLCDGLKSGMTRETLLGVTGSGKTFTVA